jgi:hypothetical protein
MLPADKCHRCQPCQDGYEPDADGLECIPIKPKCSCLEIEVPDNNGSYTCERCPMWQIPSADKSTCEMKTCKDPVHEIIGSSELCHSCIKCQIGSLPDPTGKEQKCLKVICSSNKSPFEDCMGTSPCDCFSKQSGSFTAQ